MSKSYNNRDLLPYSVVVAAIRGDVEAINTVLNYYSGYIAALSTHKLYDETGNPRQIYDAVLKLSL